MTEIVESQLDRTKRKGKRKRCKGCGGALPRTKLYDSETKCIKCRNKAGEVVKIIAEPTEDEQVVLRFKPPMLQLSDKERVIANRVREIVEDV